MRQDCINLFPDFNILWSALIEMTREGVMLVSHDLQPIYLNLKAREICQKLWNDYQPSESLPPVISDIYHRLITNFRSKQGVFVMDYQIAEEQTIRIRTYCLTLESDNEINKNHNNYLCLLIVLEDRNETLQRELKIEQKKYNLTDRETQILNFVVQGYTYQEIARALQISFNTVKFHLKNIYSKKRSCLGKQEAYIFEIGEE